MKNKHLSFDDRLEIEKGLKDNLSFKAISKLIDNILFPANNQYIKILFDLKENTKKMIITIINSYYFTVYKKSKISLTSILH